MDLQDYIEQHSSPESVALQQINRETHIYTLNPHMLCGHIEGRLLSMLSHMIRPRRILELGTFTAYSALCLAEGLQEDGILHTIERNDELEERILQNLAYAPEMAQRIRLHIGDAREIIPTLNEQFDLVFIDADKRQYNDYYDLVFPLVPIGGYIFADNTLWDGHIIDPAYDKDHQTIALRAFNDRIANDQRIDKLILPLRDGISILRKKAE
ncbi:MAG: O-methyltransferase [Paludibacter sp.]|nr:O-methyltransferase [Bacteroidales bacterium]MCM1069098.1 O-methyltransferase [Prevotella sp.]MCM1353537.1 O-methyltransferase [Bacteroides sp.]MCM1442698.1 O-methyltransferase [Muribaculum sp.]MCM1481666.1 O-methyltransferase [Paludibacter sp.]